MDVQQKANLFTDLSINEAEVISGGGWLKTLREVTGAVTGVVVGAGVTKATGQPILGKAVGSGTAKVASTKPGAYSIWGSIAFGPLGAIGGGLFGLW